VKLPFANDAETGASQKVKTAIITKQCLKNFMFIFIFDLQTKNKKPGNYQFECKLFDDVTAGNQIGSTQTVVAKPR